MAKKSKETPLTEVEEFYIEGNCCSKTLKEIASDLGRTQVSIKEFYEEALNSQKDTEEEDEKPAGDGRANSLMGRDENKRCVVMTKAASEVGDASRKKAQSAKITKCTQKIK